MAGEPEITIVGSLGGDPELRFTPGGKAVATFNVAVGSRKKEGDSWKDDGTTWYRCTAWELMAENVAESLVKGTRVMVQGRLRNREWKNEEKGTSGRSLEIQVNAVGPELRYATAKVVRLQSTGGPAQDNQGWSGSSDEPPF